MKRRHGIALWILVALFALRVAGQALVESGFKTALPPRELWQSGLLPYPLLLASQIVLLAIMCREAARVFSLRVGPRNLLGSQLASCGAVYAALMAVRAVAFASASLKGILFYGGPIPILFHLVLAGFLSVLGRFHLQAMKPS